MALGDYLRQAREKKDMSLRDVESALKRLDDAVSVSSGHLSQIEQGKVKPTPKTLHSLARALGLDYLTLMVQACYLDASALDGLPTPSIAFRGAETLDDKEVRQVEDYIDYIRSRKRRPRDSDNS